MRVTYDREANAVYIHLAEEPLPSGRHSSIPAQAPEGVEAFVVLDWRDDCLIGIEVLDASSRLPDDLLDQAEIIG
jgi:uncharacterized protein YuzE